MIDVDTLEALAKAADCVPCVPDAFLLRKDREACDAFQDAVNPSTILALIAEMRALREDVERYRWAIAYEDNAEALLAAVMNNAPDKKAISAEIDAERSKEQA